MKHTEETKLKMRIAKLKNPVKFWLGKKILPQTREALIKANTGSKYNLGRKLTEETRVKLSAAANKRWRKWRESNEPNG